jgi:ketosteroid isomerase-like protein
MADADGPMHRRFIDALMTGARGAVPMTPDAVLWHNFDEVEAPLASAWDTFAAFRAVLPDVRFDEIREVVAGGDRSIAQYVFTATLPDGSILRVPACAVFTEERGLLHRVEEYVDSAQVAPAAAVMAAAPHP